MQIESSLVIPFQAAITDFSHSYNLGLLRQQLSCKSEDLGSSMAKLDLVERSLFVAEEKIKSLLDADRERDGHLKKLQENCSGYEAELRQVDSRRELEYQSKFLLGPLW
jgi:hypothetical protein